MLILTRWLSSASRSLPTIKHFIAAQLLYCSCDMPNQACLMHTSQCSQRTRHQQLPSRRHASLCITVSPTPSLTKDNHLHLPKKCHQEPTNQHINPSSNRTPLPNKPTLLSALILLGLAPKRIPEPQRLVASARHDGVARGTHGQVQNAICMSSQADDL